MTVQTTSRLVIYQGNGATTTCPFNLLIPTDTLSVSVINWASKEVEEVLTLADYSVTGLDDPLGGTVIYNPMAGALAADKGLLILRTVPYTQDLDIEPFGGFNPDTLEAQLDQIVMQVQQIAEAQERSLVVLPGQTPPTVESIELNVAAAAASAASASASAGAAAASETAAAASEAAAAASAVTAQGFVDSISADVAILAPISADIVTVAANIVDVQNAQENAQLAKGYATNPEDAPVETGPDTYSALHWAAKAQELRDQVDALLATGRVPLGTIIHSAIPQTANGFLLCDGAPVTALYPDLRAALIAAGSPFGVSGSDPLLPDEVTVSRFRRAANGSLPVGTVQDDQMQTITGEARLSNATGLLGETSVESGAFKRGTVFANAPSTVSATGYSLQFDSSLSPGARTGDETRPKSIAYLPYIKAFGAITIEGMADLSQLLNAIATEAEAILGTNNTKLMTPLRTWQSGAAREARLLHVRDQKASGTNGGTSAANTIQVRQLNTVVANGIDGASLSSNQITLPAGKYKVFARVPAHGSGRSKALLRTSGGTVLCVGSNAYIASGVGVQTDSEIFETIELGATTVIEMAHYTQLALATSGLGVAVSSGFVEVFTEVMIWKVD